MNDVAFPIPTPTAQVQPYVDALGPELAVTFLLSYGGAELYLADDPKGASSHERLIGYDAAKRLSAIAHRLPRRVPLAKRWLAAMLTWQGRSSAEIARTLRISDVTVRRYQKQGAAQ